MRTIRRFYFYAVSLISIEVVIWGVIRLLRNLFGTLPGAAATSVLAVGLALVLVGLPIFWLHWRTVQREAFRDEEERGSRVRALFLYAVLLGTLVPVVQSVLGLLTRQVFNLLDLDPVFAYRRAFFGGNQTNIDNLIALAVNLVAAGYFYRVTQQDWQANPLAEELRGVRRLYRYVWVTYGLALLTAGVRLVLGYLFSLTVNSLAQDASTLGNGLSFLLVGAPVFAWTWGVVQRSLDQKEEAQSILRLVYLYLVTLVSLVAVLGAAGLLLNALLNWVLGKPDRILYLIASYKGSLGTLIPFGVLWAYFSRILNREVAGLPDEPRRNTLRRVYNSILAFLGTMATFFGANLLLYFVIRVLLLRTVSFSTGFASERGLLASGITLLIIGLPLWLLPWRLLQAEASRPDESGDHARRSVDRKAYLYLILFLSVAGLMVTAGWTLYLVINRLLGSYSGDFARETAQWIASLLVVAVWLVYHLNALRQDNRTAQRWLEERHARFPALIIQGEDERLVIELVQALQRNLPRLPISVHRAENGAPGENLRQAAVVILPADLAVHPNEALRLWLNEYPGQRVVAPVDSPDWVWLGVQRHDARESARLAAQAVRQLAEGQEVRLSPPTSPWAVVGYILSGVTVFLLLMLLVSLIVSIFS